jgi:plastocyanin
LTISLFPTNVAAVFELETRRSTAIHITRHRRFPERIPEQQGRKTMMKTTVTKFGLLAGGLMFAGGLMLAGGSHEDDPPSLAQVVALDECDPATFNAALGPDFCKNVALGATTKLTDLFAGAHLGKPDPGWDFEPDTVHMKMGTILDVVDQGGEPHTFTEVEHFGGGFLPVLNAPGEETVQECADGFSNVAVARTRILQGSHTQITGLSKGEHLFQCCIHPWMRVKVEVK